jgi:hypothetical protein
MQLDNVFVNQDADSLGGLDDINTSALYSYGFKFLS